MKCPRCGGVLNEYGDLFVCESCGAKFKNKSAQREQKQEEQVVQNTATESVIMPETKNESEKSELELLKERLAEMEKRQSEMESGGNRRNADFKGKFSQIKETKFFGFWKKWGLKVILPCVLAFIVLISLMVSLVGVRGVYYNVNNPNEFYSFSSSKYEYYGDFNGEEYVDKGTWKTKNGKLYLTYKDEEFGKQTDEYYFSKQSNKVIFIGEEKDSLSEFKRVSLSKYKPSSNKKVKITFDANGGSGDTSVSYSFGSKSKDAPQTEREGYFFKGWYKDKYGYKISGSKPYEEGKRVWEDVTYYANWWSDKTYTLTVEGTDIALELEEGDSLLSKLKETEKGYAYNYFIDGALVDENTRMPANPVTISRQQTSTKTIKLTLNAVGGNFNGVGEITKNVAYNSDFTLDVPKSEGMFFAGYVIYPKNSEACISVATHDGRLTNDFWNNVYEDVTLYASWIDLATELADFKYRINDDGICITQYIGKNAVVKIPDSVTSIGYSAFKGCTGLTNVTIGNGVKNIGDYAFNGCSGLKSINVSKNNSAYSSVDGILYDKNKTQIIYVPYAIQGAITIPDSMTSIGSSAFNGCSGLTNVTIGNGVTSIGNYAFYGCTGLTSITIPDSVTSIGNYAFSKCTGLTSVTIGNSVTSIGYEAFWGCTGLTSVTIPNSVTSIGNYAFEGCTGLKSIAIPDSVTSIGYRAFIDCYKLTSIYYTGNIAGWCGISGLDNLMSNSRSLYIGGKKLEGDLVIPGSVTSIGDCAFEGCSGLTSITIPNSVTSIGDDAFYGCSKLQDIYITDIAAWCNISGVGKLMSYGSSNKKLYINNELATSITIPNGVTAIPSSAFSGCSGLTSVTIPNSVTSIGGGAFYGCSGLTSITIPDSVKSIGDYAFYICSGLTSVTIGASVTSIGKESFRGCSKLTSITIPDSVTSIGSYAFYNCTSLTSITIGNGVTSIGYEAFRYCTGLTSVTIGNSVTGIGYGAFRDCKMLTSVTIGNSVTSIGDYAFYNCTSLTSVTIPGSVTSIGKYAFYGCKRLTSVTIPDGVTSIGDYAFSGCTGLTSVTIGNGVTSIGDYAFYNCTGLTSVKIGNSVTSIGEHSFNGCRGLTSITIPNSVTRIGGGAFSDTAWYKNQPDGLVYAGNVAYKYKGDMPSNTSIVLKEGTLGITGYAFYECRGLKRIIIPDSVTSIGEDAFKNCSSLTSVTIGNGVKSIGESAFSGCTGLTSITIPNSVTSIGIYAFYGCKGLTSVTIPDSVTYIGRSAFADCTGLTSITFNGTIAQWKAIYKVDWKQNVPATKVVCTDGTTSI